MPRYDLVAVLLQSRLDIGYLSARRGVRDAAVGEVVSPYAAGEIAARDGLDEVEDGEIDMLDLGRDDHVVQRRTHGDVLVGVDADGHRPVRARGLEDADARTGGDLEDHVGAGV